MLLILVFLSQKELSLLRAENRKLHRALLMRVYVTRRAKNSSILLNPRIISRYEKNSDAK
ncbi:Uncharacterised protein [Bacteroides thetaiotaomicron]|nr:Uncharacterised protein [Bacteroides thetaiotaomicron]